MERPDMELQKAFGEPSSYISELESVDYKGRPVDHAKIGRWKATSFLLVAEVLERFSYYGIVANLVTYLTTVLHQGTVQSATNVFNWEGATWITPLFGAFIADAFLGRFRTLVFFFVPYMLGLLFLTLSVALPQLRPPQCASGTAICTLKPTPAELGFFWVSLYLIAFALAGVKPCIVTFSADQFDEGVPAERRLKHSFFNWFYYCFELGAFLAQTVLVYIQDNVGWGWGYGIPLVALSLSFTLTLAGTPLYRHQKLPHYNPFTCVAQVLVAAFRNRRVVSSDPSDLYEVRDASLYQRRQQVQHTTGLLFLDKAAAIPETYPVKLGSDTHEVAAQISHEKGKNPWRLCTVTQVEEFKQLLRMLPIWFANSIFAITFPALVTTYFTKQGRTMDRHMGPHFQVPAASLQGFITISILILIPIYDRVFVPVMRSLTGNERGITILTRMGIGLFMAIIACIAAALIEMKRLRVVREHGLLNSPTKVVPITVFWLLPQYLMIGICEVFISIAHFEFFYTQAAPRLRTLSMAMVLCSIGVGLFWGTALTDAVVRITSRHGQSSWIVNNINLCRLDKLYWLVAVIMAVNFCFFLLVACRYQYRVDTPVQSNQIFPVEEDGRRSDVHLSIQSNP